MANKPEVSSELSRELNLFHVCMMGIGMMIGAGVFVGIGLCMSKAGPGGLLLTFALNGLIALFSAMSFAELASAIPRAGGAYNFARIAFGRPASFIAGWMEWMAASAAGAFYALVLTRYTLDFVARLGVIAPLPEHHLTWLLRVVAALAALGFAYVNFRGSSETGKLGAIFTVAQMVFVLAIGIIGTIVFFFNPSRIENFEPFLGDGNWIKLLGSMGIIYVAFEGFEVIAQAGDETIDPKKNIPKAILYSVAIVTATYLLVAFGTLCAVRAGHPALEGMSVAEWIGSKKEVGFQAAVDVLMRGWGGFLVTLAVIFSATSALNATIYSATRTSFALGRDRMLPGCFSTIHSRTKTPYLALLVTVVLVLGIVFIIPDIEAAGATTSIMFLLLFLMVNLCVIRVRYRMGDELEYGYLMPLFPVFPILAIITQAFMGWGIFGESRMAVYIACGWVAAGVVAWRFYSRNHAVATEDEIHVFEEQQAGESAGEGRFKVMVAMANPRNALQMVGTTYKISRARDAHVELLHMVPVPKQVALTDAERFMAAGKEAMLETMLYLQPMFPVSTTIRYCRSISRGIVSAAKEKRVDLLVMGWHGRHRAAHFALGRTVDPIVEQAHCDVLILKGNCNKKFKKILVPLAGGGNGALALQTATLMADSEGGEVTVLNIDTGHGGFDAESFIAEQDLKSDVKVHSKTVRSRHIVEAILKESADFGLVIAGCTRRPLLHKFTHGSIPEELARSCEKPMIMVNANRGLSSILKRWL